MLDWLLFSVHYFPGHHFRLHQPCCGWLETRGGHMRYLYLSFLHFPCPPSSLSINIHIYIYFFVPLFLRFSCSCTTTTKSLDTEHSFPTQTWSVGLMTRDLSQWSVSFISRAFFFSKNFLVSDDPSEHERPFGLEDTSWPLYRNSPQNHPLHLPGSSWPLGYSSSRPRGLADPKFQQTYGRTSVNRIASKSML